MANLQSGMKITPARSRGYQANNTVMTITAATFGTVTIPFPTAFAAVPAFTASIVGGAGALVKATLLVTSVTASQAVVRVDLTASTTASLTVSWIAAEI